jgi:hypothetical protein
MRCSGRPEASTFGLFRVFVEMSQSLAAAADRNRSADMERE